MNNKNSYKFLIVLSMLYITSSIASGIVVRKLVYFSGLIFDGGTIIFPFTFLINDIITEVYGYKIGRQVSL